MASNYFSDELFDGLKELEESSFPKTCKTCGRVFKTSAQFLQETEDLPLAKTCIKPAVEDDGTRLLEVFRNCPCGSTLMDEFMDRRDTSEKGLKRRQLFNRMLTILVEIKGVEETTALTELKKAVRGIRSELIEAHFRKKGGNN